jgi:hypothetical protein
VAGATVRRAPRAGALFCLRFALAPSQGFATPSLPSRRFRFTAGDFVARHLRICLIRNRHPTPFSRPQTTYNPSGGTLAQGIPGGFTSVAGNVEVVVVPTPGGTFTLNVGDVGALARGGVAFLEEQDTRVQSLTDDLRNVTQQFTLTIN